MKGQRWSKSPSRVVGQKRRREGISIPTKWTEDPCLDPGRLQNRNFRYIFEENSPSWFSLLILRLNGKSQTLNNSKFFYLFSSV